MYNKILIIFLWGLFITPVLSAQTTVPGGNVSGTWTVAGSPYQVEGSITVGANSTLIIEAGVKVEFQGWHQFKIDGILQANGTETDSIYFVPANITTRWDGIAFYNTTGSLTYSNISYTSIGFGALYFNNSTVDLSHCTISDNTASGSAGLDIELGSRVTVSNCAIIRNSAPYFGGGIGLWHDSYLSLSNSVIQQNTSQMGVDQNDGGGIWSGSSDSLIISNCVFSENVAGDLVQSTGSRGGAVAITSGNGYVSISGCTFNNNQATEYGGAVYLSNCQAVVTESHFISNSTTYAAQGVALYAEHCDPILSHNMFLLNHTIDLMHGFEGVVFVGDSSFTTIDHCNFYSNNNNIDGDKTIYISSNSSLELKNSIFLEQLYGVFVYFESSTIASVSFCDFYNPGYLFFNGSVPAGLGTISGTNANGDSCDTFNNIFLDPLYVDPFAGDFHLQSTSPCIDAGDPTSPEDPDSTVADIGRYFYFQGMPVISPSDTLLDFGTVILGQQHDLPLTIRNVGSDTLILYSIHNQQSVFTHNWNLADSLVLPGDSLLIMVTFTPLDTNLIVDTLLIENNDIQFQAQFLGKGEMTVGIKDISEVPKAYELYAAYPNPFNTNTTIEFDLSRPGFVTLKVYNISGEEVGTLISKHMNSGRHKYIWNVNNFAGGIYLYRLNTNQFNKSRTVILQR